jgi:hypothetical protein
MFDLENRPIMPLRFESKMQPLDNCKATPTY